MALEQPKFILEKVVDGVEIRRYEPYQLAQCTFENLEDLRAASNAGFRYLFNYISGENQQSQKISMTVPVQQVPSKSGWSISFVVPSSFAEGAVPTPSNSRVEIVTNPGGLVAALRYRGLWGSTSFNEQSKKLLSILKKHNLKTKGEVFSAVYNPPLTPPFLRRNEVLVRLA